MPIESTDAAWRRSRYCVGEAHCVEVADLDGYVGLRNSQAPALTLVFDKAEWRTFVDAVKAGEILSTGRY